ncbi:MAG: permease-like cell division protein FtsX [Candidatus Fournierella pullistercoris]|uniref:Cell division protein FtsX n=1 Tax=Candidatus Allofournierella pullistercoris TaxID=2838597 RepID=A0A948T146_9FIRM|nr:permease-like cell division protein FtsX [Candidatus Fournierella pullistercoris]
MMLSSFFYLAKQGLGNLIKNRLMTFASIGVLTVCLIITGVAGLFTANVNSLMEYLRGQNELVLYPQEELDELGLAQLDAKLREISGIKEIEYISKEEAMERMKQSMGDKAYLLDVLEGDQNPLRVNYRIVLEDVGALSQIVPQLQAIEGVDNVLAPVELSDVFVNVHKAVVCISVGLVVVLGFVSVVVISNTIRLTVFARRKEINIMKYVGATNGFIRMPFFVEGIAVGLIAGVISAGIVLGGYQLLLMNTSVFPAFWSDMVTSILLPMDQIWWMVLCGFLLFGSLLGSVGTATSVRKHLKV